MEQPETIMLNIVVADVDCTTSQALQMSRHADPEQRRTILCVTKIDKVTGDGILEARISAIRQALGTGIPVFAVRNRTQQENDDGLALTQARELEDAYFAKLPSLAEEMKGVGALFKKLVQLQLETIQHFTQYHKARQRLLVYCGKPFVKS